MGLWGRVFGGSGDDVSGGLYEHCGWRGRGIQYRDTAAIANLNTERSGKFSKSGDHRSKKVIHDLATAAPPRQKLTS